MINLKQYRIQVFEESVVNLRWVDPKLTLNVLVLIISMTLSNDTLMHLHLK